MISFYAGDVLAKTVITFVIFSDRICGSKCLILLKTLPDMQRVVVLCSDVIRSSAVIFLRKSPFSLLREKRMFWAV
jgi:hypothetical protein